MAFGPADRDGTNQNKDRTWKGPSVKLWVTAPAATFPLSPVHQTGITIINVNPFGVVCWWRFRARFALCPVPSVLVLRDVG